MNYFLLSVVIPTRNRDEYAYYAIKQILSIEDERIQVVVQNNSDKDDLREMLKEFRGTKRLKYNYIPTRLSGVDNFNSALGLADGSYVVVIGDDDGVNPQIMQCIEWMDREGIDVVKPAISLGYNWPSKNEDNSGKLKTAIVRIDQVNGKRKLCNPKEGIIKLMKSGGQNYLELEIAKSYHGIVKRECFEKVKEKTGCYFGGLSPDIYSAVALSLIDNIKMVEVNYPFTISGVCMESTSAASANGKHVGKLSEAPHFIGKDNYNWEIEIPPIYSVETIWAETALKSVRECGREDLINMYFSLNNLLKYCISNNLNYKKIILNSTDKKYENFYHKVNFWVGKHVIYKSKFIRKTWRFIKRKLNIDYVQGNIMNMEQAGDVIAKKLSSSRMKRAFEKALAPLDL